MVERSTQIGLPKLLILWLVFLGICAGLGYSAIRRYDPRDTGGVGDAADYVALVQHGMPAHPDSHRPYRVFMPYAAKPIYYALNSSALRNYHGGLDPALLALLVVCWIACATTALGIVVLTLLAGADGQTSLLAACLYLLNFWVTNHFLAGLVDGGEMCAGVFLLIGLWQRRWWLVALSAVLGALTKETFVVAGAVMAGTWWLLHLRESGRWTALAAIATSFAAALLAVLIVRWRGSGNLLSPEQLASTFSRDPDKDFAGRFRDAVLDVQFWFGFYWALPLAIFAWRSLPLCRWILPAIAATLAMLVLGIYHDAGAPNVGRPVFSMIGPLLSAGAAITLSRMAGPRAGIAETAHD